MRRSVILTVGLLGWGLYKVTSTTHVGGGMIADTSCQTDPAATVDLNGNTPADAPISCESWDIGTGVSGYSWQAPQPLGVVLFQHGWGDYAQRWVNDAHRLIPHLIAEGLSVYAFDMRGNGRSPGKRGIVDVGQAIQDHLVARRALREQPLPVFLMGHSLGGLVTATSTIKDQDDVAGVVLLAPAVKYDVGGPLRLVVRVGAFLAPTLPVPLKSGPAITRDAQALAKMEADPLMVMAGMNWLTAAGGATNSHQNWRGYRQVRVPVLAIHGSDDGSTDPTGSSELVESLASKDKTFHLVQGGQHALLDDVSADETLTVVLDWLRARVQHPTAGEASGN